MVDHADDRAAPDEDSQAGEGAGADAAGGGERVAKALARAGVASRRDVERYIAAGRVALNGRVLETPAVKVSPGDVLTVDGAVVGGPEATRVWRHHKPAGLLTSHGDPAGRPTVFEHMPADLPRVISVGRLDLATEGLLLLTNDGELARRLELPDNGWRRVYRARAHGRADQARLDTLKAGVTIDGVRYGPVEARLDKATGAGAVGRGRVSEAPANLWITITVAEGKNREVRRVLEHLGLKVNRLIRLAYGPFALGELLPGEVEEIAPRVLREQLAGLVAPESLPKGNRRPGPPARGAPAHVAPPVRAPSSPDRSAGRAARPQGPQASAPPPRGRGGAPERGGKPGPRPAGAAGRVSGAWTPPAERGPRAAPGAKPPGGGRGAPRGGPAPGASAGPFRGRPGEERGGEGRAPRAPRTGDAPRTSRTAAADAPSRPSPERSPRAGPGGGPRGSVRPAGPGDGGKSTDGKPPGSFGGRPFRAAPGGKPSSAAPGGKSFGASRGAKPAARSGAPTTGAGQDSPRATGLELASPMRRGPRRKPGEKAPRRPPRGS